MKSEIKKALSPLFVNLTLKDFYSELKRRTVMTFTLRAQVVLRQRLEIRRGMMYKW